MAAAGFTTHSMQVMHRKRAVPRCPSTQTAAGVKSAFGRLLASERMSDGRAGQGEPDSSRKRCAEGVFAMVLAQDDRSLGAIERERACTASRATKQRMSLQAAAHSGSAFTSIQNSSLAPRRRTRLLLINIHGCPGVRTLPTHAPTQWHTRARCQ